MDYSLIFNNFIIWIEFNYIFALFLFFFFILFYSILSLPGLVIFFVFAGYSFGIFWSYIICLIGVTFGSLFFFIISKYILSKFFKKFYKKYTDKVEHFIKDSTLEYLIIFRILPGTPLMIQNILLSLLDISIFKFIFSTSIGLSPIIVFCIFIGNKINSVVNLNNVSSNNIISWDLFLILFILIAIISIRIYFKKKSTN